MTVENRKLFQRMKKYMKEGCICIFVKWNILKNDVFEYLDKMEYIKE